MDEVRDIAGISVPFAAGVAAGTSLAMAAGSVALLAIVCAAAAVGLARDMPRRGYSVMFFFAGMFCAAASSACPWHDAGSAGPARRACAALKEVIDRIPFEREETGALLKALMTGDRSSLSKETVAVFRASGASHILALSGLHLGFIYLFISKVFTILGNSPVSRKARCFCIIAGAGFYTLMTGAGPSIVRAFLFITIREISKISSGRTLEPGRTLLLCLTIQLALKPSVITGVGFQLSYLAMCGIIFLLPVLQEWYPQGPKWDPMRYLWNAAALAISCQIFTAPVSWMKFHTFPRYFLITNITALPLTSAMMMLSIVAVVLSALGICPEALVSVLEACIGLLVRLLELISMM